MSSIDISKYVENGVVNSRIVSSDLRGVCCMNRYVSDSIAASLDTNLNIHDMSSLFTIMAVIEDTLMSAELGEIQLQPSLPVPGNITYLNMRDAAVPPAVGPERAFIAELQAGHVFLRFRDLQPADITLLGMISAGLPGFVVPELGPRPTGLYLLSRGLHFVIWDDQAIVPPPQVVNLRAVDVAASANRICLLLDCLSDLVKGFTRAATIVNGMLFTEEAGGMEQRRFYTAGLETRSLALPRVHDSNPIWRILKIFKPKADAHLYKAEYAAINEQPPELRQLIGVGTAHIYSLGDSACFHLYNLTGTQINRWFRPGGPDVRHLSRQVFNLLFYCLDVNAGTIMNRMSCNFAGLISEATINVESVRTRSFCQGGFDLQLEKGQGWGGLWPLVIPYICRPKAQVWAYKKWPHLWCITSPITGFDFTHEIVRSYDLNQAGLFLYRGKRCT